MNDTKEDNFRQAMWLIGDLSEDELRGLVEKYGLARRFARIFAPREASE